MEFLKKIGKGPVCLDTAVFIYFIEAHETYLKTVNPIFEAIDQGSLQAYTSGITLLETLVVPLREGDYELARQYEHLLLESKGLTILPLEFPLLRQAAVLRARWGIKTPDAIQIASAQITGCSTFVTHDRRLPQIEGLRILQLSD
jgi:predicted nucleic acid-binding protein